MIHCCGAGIPAPLRFLSLVGSRASVGVPSLTHLAPCSYSEAWCELLRGGSFGRGKSSLPESSGVNSPERGWARQRSMVGGELPLRAGRARGKPSRRAAASVALGEALEGERGGNLVGGLVEARLEFLFQHEPQH